MRRIGPKIYLWCFELFHMCFLLLFLPFFDSGRFLSRRQVYELILDTFGWFIKMRLKVGGDPFTVHWIFCFTRTITVSVFNTIIIPTFFNIMLIWWSIFRFNRLKYLPRHFPGYFLTNAFRLFICATPC